MQGKREHLDNQPWTSWELNGLKGMSVFLAKGLFMGCCRFFGVAIGFFWVPRLLPVQVTGATAASSSLWAMCPLFLFTGGKLRHGWGKRPPAFQLLPPTPVKPTGKTGSCWDCFKGEEGAPGRIGLYFCFPGLNGRRKHIHGAKMQQLPRG